MKKYVEEPCDHSKYEMGGTSCPECGTLGFNMPDELRFGKIPAQGEIGSFLRFIQENPAVFMELYNDAQHARRLRDDVGVKADPEFIFERAQYIEKAFEMKFKA